MIKAELIDILAERHVMRRWVVEVVVDAIFDHMTDTLKRGERIELREFGSFQLREYRSYIGRNPRTGKEFLVQPKRLPVFKMSKMLYDQLNRGLDG